MTATRQLWHKELRTTAISNTKKCIVTIRFADSELSIVPRNIDLVEFDHGAVNVTSSPPNRHFDRQPSCHSLGCRYFNMVVSYIYECSQLWLVYAHLHLSYYPVARSVPQRFSQWRAKLSCGELLSAQCAVYQSIRDILIEGLLVLYRYFHTVFGLFFLISRFSVSPYIAMLSVLDISSPL